MKVYGFVPAKGTSERIDNKNMRFLNGERLFIKALKVLLSCTEIDEVFLDTESDEMYSLVDYLPVRFMKRDTALASNNTDGHQMFLNEVKSYPDADIYVQLLCTSPFIKPETIDSAIRKIKESSIYDSAIMMKKDKYYFWSDNYPKYDIDKIPNSKDLPDTITESMGLYIVKKDTALKCNRRYGNSPYFIFGKQEELVDVNNFDDLQFAEIYAKGLKSTEIQNLNLMKHFITSSAISDILDDIENQQGEKCGAVLNGFSCNLDNCKLFGRANTLKLRPLKQNEDFKGIYTALNSYQGIADNDIIIVENEVGEFAYFGDLNTRLAIRSGAVGAIINGATRDLAATTALNFPVFAKSYNAKDVRRRATVESINKPINISGVTINPSDLIFVDECALVIIYQKYEDEVIRNVLETYKNENKIISDILSKVDIDGIISRNGTF